MDFTGSQAPLPGFRNLLINGNFTINQRGYASGGVLASSAYAHDRWRDVPGGSAYTFTQPSTAEQAATHTVDNLITITSGSLTQPVEAQTIAGGPYTLSWVGSALGVLAYYNGSAYTNVAVGSSPLTAMIPAGVSVYATFNGGTLGTVQLEAGVGPTLFERRPIGVELALCQRYYEVGHARFVASVGRKGDFCGPNIPFKVTKRTSPSVSVSLPLEAYNISQSEQPQNIAVGLDSFSYTQTSTNDLGQTLFSNNWSATAEL